MSKPDHQKHPANVLPAKPRIERVSATERQPRSSGVFLRNRQDFIRAFMMHEILAEPKCKQSSSRKQF
ncbi:MAG: hypothetical protein RJA02_347 [Armatimonadota bacterium]|jgi:hypothetical protein